MNGFLRGKSAPEILVHCGSRCLRTPKKHDPRGGKILRGVYAPLSFFSEWYSNTLFRWGRSGDIHTVHEGLRKNVAAVRRFRWCRMLLQKYPGTKVTWHCALVLVADALRMDLRTGVAAWSRPEHYMRRVATKTSGTCALRGWRACFCGYVILGGTVGHTRENPLGAFVQHSFGFQTVLDKRVRMHRHDG